VLGHGMLDRRSPGSSVARLTLKTEETV
jgi:hypothetical protein